MSDQGSTYASFVESELRAEHVRRDVLDARALNVVSISSGLVTLMVALGAFATAGRKNLSLPRPAVVILVIALVAFVFAALLALIAQDGRRYKVAATKTLERMIIDHWRDDQVDSRFYVSLVNVRTIDTLRSGNNRKAALLTSALAAQLVAILALSMVVTIVMASAVHL